jgi:hypothetical protein
MLKVILKTFLGLLITALGFCLTFFYLIKIDDGCTPLLLIPAVALIIGGIYLLMRAGKSDVTVIKKPDMPLAAKDASNAGLEEVFNKNNQLSSQWAKTVEKRDKLKMLEISGAVEEQE